MCYIWGKYVINVCFYVFNVLYIEMKYMRMWDKRIIYKNNQLFIAPSFQCIRHEHFFIDCYVEVDIKWNYSMQ